MTRVLTGIYNIIYNYTLYVRYTAFSCGIDEPRTHYTLALILQDHVRLVTKVTMSSGHTVKHLHACF